MARYPYTQMTLKLLRAAGWECDKAEYWLSFGGKGGIRKDLFEFIDIVAITDDVTAGVQCTSASCRSARRRKILGSDKAKKWVQGRMIMLVTWAKRKNRWVPTIEHIGPEQFQ